VSMERSAVNKGGFRREIRREIVGLQGLGRWRFVGLWCKRGSPSDNASMAYSMVLYVQLWIGYF